MESTGPIVGTTGQSRGENPPPVGNRWETDPIGAPPGARIVPEVGTAPKIAARASLSVGKSLRSGAIMSIKVAAEWENRTVFRQNAPETAPRFPRTACRPAAWRWRSSGW